MRRDVTAQNNVERKTWTFFWKFMKFKTIKVLVRINGMFLKVLFNLCDLYN